MLYKISKKYKSSGLLGLILACIKKIGVFEYFVVFYTYRAPLKSLCTSANFLPNVATKVLSSPEDLNDIVKVKNKYEIFLYRIKNNNFAVLLYVDHIPVGYMWGQLDSPHYEERYGFKIPISEKDVYYFDSYINPDYRGLGLLKHLFNEFIDFSTSVSRKENVTAIIEKTNLDSVVIHETMGFKRVDLHITFKLFCKDFHFLLKKYTDATYVN